MNRKTFLAVVTAAMLAALAVGAFATDTPKEDVAGAVYTMTNAADNAVVIFDRDADGLLTEVGTVATEGSGSGDGLDPLVSQNSLVLSEDHQWLLAVNAGSDEISVFRVRDDGLELTDKVGSGGSFPVSLTVDHDLVYVLNSRDPANITGFYLTDGGRLMPIADSTRSLGSGGFPQVGFDPSGTNLVVTDRMDHEILVYQVGRGGRPAMDPVTSPASGLGPFSFIFDRRGHLLVAEAGSGAVSSYRILGDGALQVISASVANGQTATCWIAGNRQGDVFTANTGSQDISAYQVVAKDGSLVLVDDTAGFANRPIDMATTANGRFLYALDPADGAVHGFRIDRHDGLIELGAASTAEIAIFAQGIAAR
jgi:6-phosphogluconolactonase (cycloisomerase 2 family)